MWFSAYHLLSIFVPRDFLHSHNVALNYKLTAQQIEIEDANKRLETLKLEVGAVLQKENIWWLSVMKTGEIWNSIKKNIVYISNEDK